MGPRCRQARRLMDAGRRPRRAAADRAYSFPTVISLKTRLSSSIIVYYRAIADSEQAGYSCSHECDDSFN